MNFKSRMIGRNIVLWSEIDWIFWKMFVSLVIIWSRSTKLCIFTNREAAKFKGKKPEDMLIHSGHPWVLSKNFCQFGPSVWPAIDNRYHIHIHTYIYYA